MHNNDVNLTSDNDTNREVRIEAILVSCSKSSTLLSQNSAPPARVHAHTRIRGRASFRNGLTVRRTSARRRAKLWQRNARPSFVRRHQFTSPRVASVLSEHNAVSMKCICQLQYRAHKVKSCVNRPAIRIQPFVLSSHPGPGQQGSSVH